MVKIVKKRALKIDEDIAKDNENEPAMKSKIKKNVTDSGNIVENVNSVGDKTVKGYLLIAGAMNFVPEGQQKNDKTELVFFHRFTSKKVFAYYIFFCTIFSMILIFFFIISISRLRAARHHCTVFLLTQTAEHTVLCFGRNESGELGQPVFGVE